MNHPVIIFDTTLRDGELTPGVTFNLAEKIALALLLEEMGVDIIEVGYPGHAEKDFEELFEISKLLTKSTICGLASSNHKEISLAAEAIKPAQKGRIHIYFPVRLKSYSSTEQEQALTTIRESVSLAKDYCDDIEWSAFDATRSQPDFLCKAIETAIDSGANTVNIPDSLGLALPEDFSNLIETIFNQVPNINKAVISVHCHNDLGKAVENSLITLEKGVKQIECSINGLGARKGNADLGETVTRILEQNYPTNIDTSLLDTASILISKLIKNSQK